MTRLSRMERWSDRIHPVIVKELRQTVRSGGASATLCLGGALTAIAMLLYLGSFGGNIPQDRPIGREVFLMLMLMLYLLALVQSLTQAGRRMREEREPGTIDLIYGTPLTAASIVYAKLFCGLYEAFLVFSIGLPMLFLTTLLRGVDAMSVVVCLGLAVPLLLGPLQVVIFVGALRVGRTLKGVVSLVAMIIVVPVSLTIFGSCVSLVVFNGVGRLFSAFISSAAVGVGFIYGMLVMVFHGISISLIAAPGPGRLLEVREVDDAPKYHF